MMTSSNGNIFRVTGPLCGEFTAPGEFPAQRPVMRSFDVFSDLRLNKRLSKQPWGWWFETPSWSLWRQCNGETVLLCNNVSHWLGPSLESTLSCYIRPCYKWYHKLKHNMMYDTFGFLHLCNFLIIRIFLAFRYFHMIQISRVISPRTWPHTVSNDIYYYKTLFLCDIMPLISLCISDVTCMS